MTGKSSLKASCLHLCPHSLCCLLTTPTPLPPAALSTGRYAWHLPHTPTHCPTGRLSGPQLWLASMPVFQKVHSFVLSHDCRAALDEPASTVLYHPLGATLPSPTRCEPQRVLVSYHYFYHSLIILYTTLPLFRAPGCLSHDWLLATSPSLGHLGAFQKSPH